MCKATLASNISSKTSFLKIPTCQVGHSFHWSPRSKGFHLSVASWDLVRKALICAHQINSFTESHAFSPTNIIIINFPIISPRVLTSAKSTGVAVKQKWVLWGSNSQSNNTSDSCCWNLTGKGAGSRQLSLITNWRKTFALVPSLCLLFFSTSLDALHFKVDPLT